MANNYSQGTVLPFLPLTRLHRSLIDWDIEDSLVDEEGNLPDASTLDTEGEARLIVDQLALSIPLTEEYQHQGTPGYETHGTEGMYYVFLENGLSEEGAAVLQRILKDLDAEEYPYLRVEGAYTCSKLRPGEFGGWACHITREDIQWGGTSSWLHQQTLTDADKILLNATRGHWDDHAEFPPEDWKYEVAHGDTRMGYRDWCNSQQENKEQGLEG